MPNTTTAVFDEDVKRNMQAPRSAILDEFPLTMRFASDHRTVTICEIVDHSTGHIYTGTAKCAPCDMFDDELGMALSLIRALFMFGADVTRSIVVNTDGAITIDEMIKGTGVKVRD